MRSDGNLGDRPSNQPSCESSWTVIVPFFNERALLPDTLASLADQSTSFDLVLVDNGSTDGSGEVATCVCAELGLGYDLVVEPNPGKVAALAAGVLNVKTPFVATCDADTWYPPDYLEQAGALLARKRCVAAGAFFVDRDAGRVARLIEGLHLTLAGWLLPGQCHAGGAGEVFRADVLRRAGSFDRDRWNWILEDHEIIHRMLKHGRMAYGLRFWSAPSARTRDRESVSWTLLERAIYHALGGFRSEWYFNHFLSPRLRRRQLSSDRLRQREDVAEVADAESYALR